ncbi:MAG: RidA family protein [Candidatus Eremiobacteraeota bacterium]|nr:RidA family protein [Candidatus Eremiobacteraeota bacterium]
MEIKRINPGSRMSQAIVYNGLVYTAGQVDSSGPDVKTQTQAILTKIDGLLAQAGTDKSRVLMANIWLSDISTFEEMNAVWERWTTAQIAPARATVESKLAGPDYRVEISIVAALKDEG